MVVVSSHLRNLGQLSLRKATKYGAINVLMLASSLLFAHKSTIRILIYIFTENIKSIFFRAANVQTPDQLIQIDTF
jgi:hypothetical protein